MGWSFPIGAVKGTVIRVHFTFILFLVWIGAASYARGGSDAAVQAVLFMILLFFCVLLHEFGHVFVARRYGVQTAEITLLPIGGVAQMERIPEKPSQELLVALAGPTVNLAIAGILLVALGGLIPDGSTEVQNPQVGLIGRLLVANLFLALFNLIPAFPMDGGRVLRAVLAYRLGYARGTQVAATVGQTLAFALGLLGLLGNPMLLFIAVFVYLGAASESHAVQMRQVSKGMITSDAMIRHFQALPPSAHVKHAVQLLLETTQHEFPVVDEAGHLRGVLTRDDIIKALRERGSDTPVLEIMRSDIPVVRDRQCLFDALRALQEQQLPAIEVTNAAGRFVGLITPENMGELMMIMAATPRGSRSWKWKIGDSPAI